MERVGHKGGAVLMPIESVAAFTLSHPSVCTCYGRV